MAVVINDMEVAPQPAAEAAPGGQPAAGGGNSGGKDKMKLIEKTLCRKSQRAHRLEAY